VGPGEEERADVWRVALEDSKHSCAPAEAVQRWPQVKPWYFCAAGCLRGRRLAL